jgi:hypothetical protein
LDRLVPSEAPRELLEPISTGSGTVVLWEGLDRVALYRNPAGARAESALRALRHELGQHLAMVFHRFLSGEARRRLPLEILVNDAPLAAWDPFVRDEIATRSLSERVLRLTTGGAGHDIRIRPFLLPSQQRFSSPEAHQAAGGPRKWNRQQGFYVYREDRLIQSGGWNRLRTQDEHTKLARVSVDIPRDTDEEFGVNVSKMRVTIPEVLRPELRAMVKAVASRAQERYRTHIVRSVKHEENGASEPMGRVADLSAEFIPRARVVGILRDELAHEPAILRRLVDAVLADDWRRGTRPSATSVAYDAAARNGSA